MGYLDEVEKKRQAAASKQSQDSDKQESISAIDSGSKSVVNEIARQGEKNRTNTQKVEVENADLAKTTDVNAVVDSINKLNMTTFMASKENWVNVVNDMSDLSERMQGVVSDLNKNGVNRLEKGLDATVNKLQSVVDSMKSISVKSDGDVVKGLKELSKSIDKINVSPTVNVPTPQVTVDSKETDLSPLTSLLEDIKSQIKNNKVSIPKTDFSSLEDTVRSVKTSIESLSFPVPNYILPYKDPTTGKATQVTLTTDGKIPVTATVSLDPAGLATDTNQTNGAQKTQIVDAGGEAVTVTGGKLDVNASVDTTGLATSARQDTGNTSVASIDTKTPALGQALAAASVPIVLTASQLSTLTPPAAITGFATSAKQDSLLTELQLKADLTETQPVSLASVPSHAVTNAGTFAVQAAGTKTNNNAAPTTDNVGVLPGLVNASSPSFTEGNQSLLSLNTTGNLRTTLNQLAGNTVSTGNGASGTGVLRVAQVSDGTGVIATVGAVTAITNALPAGTNAIGKLAANSGVDIGDVDVTSLPAWGTVSTANSTTANLAGGAAFTGTSENVSGYAAIEVSIFSSHASATDGLSLQQSSNGTNWDLTDTYTIAATTGKVFAVQPSANFFRLVYTNGATLTTSLRIQTVFHVIAPNPSSQRPADAYTNETDMTQNWAFASLYNGTTWDRMRGDTTNGLDVDVTRLPALVAGSALVGKVGIDQTTPGTTNAIVDTPVTSGGLGIVTGSVGATATAIKASAGQLYGYHLFNTTAAVAYVQIFNVAAASVTLGTTAPTFSIGIPASGGVTVNFDKGIAFGTAISFGCTTTRTGSTGATCDVNFFYK